MSGEPFTPSGDSAAGWKHAISLEQAMSDSGAGPPERREEKTTCYYQGYNSARAAKRLWSFAFRQWDIQVADLIPVGMPVASSLVDVKEDMKAMADSLAISDVARPARQIWRELRSLFYGNDNNNVMIGLSESQVISRIYRARAMHYSGDVHGSVEIPPLSLVQNEAVSFFQFHFVSSNRQDVSKPTRLLGWAHPALLNPLRYHNITLFIDGTFRCVPRNFQQCVVFMVHDRASGLFVPVFYILSTSRSRDAYWDMMHFVLQATDQQLSPAEVICDFESALIEAVQTRFRDTIVLGSVSPLRRAMKRLAIPEPECIVAMTRGVVDMLTVVKPEHVQTRRIEWVKREIKRRCEEQAISYSALKWQAFWEYFQRTWVDGYGVEVWNVHGMENELVARTNNPLERFNRVLNTCFPTHPSIATFVTTINQISVEYAHQLTDIPRGRAQRLPRETIELPVPVELPEDLEKGVEAEAEPETEQSTVASTTSESVSL